MVLVGAFSWDLQGWFSHARTLSGYIARPTTSVIGVESVRSTCGNQTPILHNDNFLFFSRMRNEGFPHFGGLGVEVCSLDGVLVSATVCNCLQPFATVRNRPRTTVVAESRRAYGKSCKRRDFWMFQVLRSFISRGRHGTL